VRHGTKLVALIADQPGPLRSTAPPPPDAGPPPPPPPGSKAASGDPSGHPFLSGQAFDAASEDRLGRILSDSASFDEYLDALVVAGFDLQFTDDPAPVFERDAGLRIRAGDTIIGAAWSGPGRLASLSEGVGNDHAAIAVTAYDAAT